MKEQLYTIPVNDAFHTDCECPLCKMHQQLEDNALEFTLGPSYMEDDVRMETNRVGFCEPHVRKLYESSNRLGLAMILETHMDEILKQVDKHSKSSKPSSSLFRKKGDTSPLIKYLEGLAGSCYICNRIEQTFQRYLATIFYLYKTDSDFKETFLHSKGFCTDHFLALSKLAPTQLSGASLNEFEQALSTLFLTNLKRVRDDLDWFIDKFDYRYVDAPWKNSKDALIRAAIKTDGVLGLKE